MQSNLKSLLTIVTIILVVVAMLYSGYIPPDQYVNRQIATYNSIARSSKTPLGYIRPQVVDGFSEMPIKGAKVVIPEIGKTFNTDHQGFTPNIRVPIIPDNHFEKIHPKPWGEVTLIVYKEGYNEYVLFHTHVWENQGRQGPKILIFPKQEDGPNSPMSIVEGPHRLWVNGLVEKYRP